MWRSSKLRVYIFLWNRKLATVHSGLSLYATTILWPDPFLDAMRRKHLVVTWLAGRWRAIFCSQQPYTNAQFVRLWRILMDKWPIHYQLNRVLIGPTQFKHSQRIMQTIHVHTANMLAEMKSMDLKWYSGLLLQQIFEAYDRHVACIFVNISKINTFDFACMHWCVAKPTWQIHVVV